MTPPAGAADRFQPLIGHPGWLAVYPVVVLAHGTLDTIILTALYLNGGVVS